MMVTEIKEKVKRKKRDKTLTVVKVEYAQVPDAEERLNRVFNILISSYENMGGNVANRR